jgi:20S proteasome alpha/beta subunit
MLTLGLVGQEAVNLGGGTVVGADGETVISNVEDQVLAHNGQTDEAEISTGRRVRRSADINAGETGTIVSDRVQVSIAGKIADHQEI